jgi:Zn-dependent M28 family amino/carboxypeptidase
MRKAYWMGLGVLCAALTAAANDVDWYGKGSQWWAHVRYLASDELEGRNTGSEGHRKAAAYVAKQFEQDGLQPAGTKGYLQPVGFDVRQIDEEHSSLELVRDGKAEALKLGEDAIFSMRSDPAEQVDASAAFVGYGFAVPERNYDDLAGMDLQGKIAVYLAGGPADIPSALRSHYQSSAERWSALKKAGAIGVAVIPNPKSMDIPWPRIALSRFQAAMSLADKSLAETGGQQIALYVNPDHADKLLAGSGHTLAEILGAADAKKPLPHFALTARIRAHQAVKRWSVESQNVVGIFPGSDPALKGEYVVLTAHLDHLGIGEPINGDKIYNGAMDDGSGVATLLETARALHDSGARTKRSVLFAVVTGEEKGLLGSRYFTMHPTVEAGSMVADLNVDMFLPLHSLHYLEIQGLGESTLGEDVREAAKSLGTGVEIQADREPDRNLFIRSDQYNFICIGVPALAFKFGYLPGSPEEKLQKAWLTKNYHAPSDDANQPVDLAAAAQFNQLFLDLVLRVANAPVRPHWNSDSFFRRFAK